MSKPKKDGLKRWKVLQHFLKICEERGVDPKAIDFDSIYEPELDYWENVEKIEAAVPATQAEALEKEMAYAEEMEFWTKKADMLEEELQRAYQEVGVPVELFEGVKKELAKARTEVEKLKVRVKEAEAAPPPKPKVVEEAEAALKELEGILGPGFQHG